MGKNKKQNENLKENLIETALSKEEVEAKAFENQQKLNAHQEAHGGKLLTRRDLLATGVISFTGTLLSQPLFSMFLSKSAVAQNAINCAAGTGGWVPLITLNLSGGANLSSHWLPLDQGGNLLPSYSKMGWGKANAFTADAEFANRAPFFGGSTLLSGIRATAAASTLSSSVFVGISVTSQDDTSTNNFDITGLARGMGLNGKILANLGTSNTATGIGQMPAFLPPPAPLVVANYQDITGALGVGGSLDPLVAAKRAGTLFQTIQQLSAYQASKYVGLNSGNLLQSVITCRTQDNTALVGSANGNNTDPRGNAQVAAIWNLQNNTAMNSRDYVFSSLVFNALNGNAGSANLNMGGYDYHDGTRTTGDGRDLTAGRIIGQILQTAMALGKKAFIVVSTDGSTTSPESDLAGAEWTSDGGVRGAMYMIAINPAAAPSAAGSQLGYMNAGQGAADPLISSPDRAAAAAFINWLSFNGQMSQIDKVLPRTFSSTEIDRMKKIA
ncbi:MAG: hypothetical protein ACAH59_05605 [Pseudobdellovibrionaceae bacterium]